MSNRWFVFGAALVAFSVAISGCSATSNGGGSNGDSVKLPDVKVSDFTTGGPDEVFAKLAKFKELATAGKGKIAVLLPDTRSAARWANADAPYFERAFETLGISKSDYMILNAQGSPSAQQTQAEQAITNGASTILLTNLDSGSGAAIQKSAAAKGVAVIDYDRLTVEGSAKYYVAFDNEDVGKREGDGLVECIKSWNVKSPEIYHLGGSPTDNNATLVEKGYDSVLDPLYSAGSANKVGAVRVTNWDNQVGQTMFEQAFQANPNINAVLSANDGLAQAVVSVLKNKKIPPRTIPTVGQDATLQALQNILAGYQCMTVYKPIYREVAAAAAIAVILRAGLTPDVAMVNGEYDAGNHTVPSVLLIPETVTSENIQDTVVRDKFIDPIELCSGSFASLCDEYGIK